MLLEVYREQIQTLSRTQRLRRRGVSRPESSVGCAVRRLGRRADSDRTRVLARLNIIIAIVTTIFVWLCHKPYNHNINNTYIARVCVLVVII